LGRADRLTLTRSSCNNLLYDTPLVPDILISQSSIPLFLNFFCCLSGIWLSDAIISNISILVSY
jgi:hypothetical protein